MGEAESEAAANRIAQSRRDMFVSVLLAATSHHMLTLTAVSSVGEIGMRANQTGELGVPFGAGTPAGHTRIARAERPSWVTSQSKMQKWSKAQKFTAFIPRLLASLYSLTHGQPPLNTGTM